ncbi:conserved hypothetical protein [Altererythrobacter sp. B11]|uniref:alpha/beta hydrolase n=1 Tax=Altererythrobacter sp. B11 TaxID=2060312 RepID=UPI000DC6DE69|nr:alpha/beta hydrolase [Altererythrobacter sp. B11]BBC70885.1 conserved hypothetical protein [Altererythrobacter sp. B11]
MRRPAPLLACLLIACAWPGAGQAHVPSPAAPAEQAEGASRFAAAVPMQGTAAVQESYGPFLVVDERTVALDGATDADSPAAFAALLRDHPAIAELSFHDCPGTYDDIANLALGRMIRDQGLITVAPEGGSVRSGAVELFLAGRRRIIADGAEFAVHTWLDEDGLEAADFGADSPQNRKYLAYYRDMGMTAEEAVRFYALTNSAPYDDALWLTGPEMREVLGPAEAELPQLADLDLAALVD